MHKVSVKSLAEFVHQRGDLYPPLDGRTRAEEGIETQRRVQRRRGADYECERFVSASFCDHGIELTVAGRADGFDPGAVLVEEIKTTRADPRQADHYLGSSHWAQVTLYAALLAREIPESDWQLQLTYCNPDDDSEHPLLCRISASGLATYLAETVGVYTRWQQQQVQYRQQRDDWLRARAFPFDEYRDHQRALAHRVFRGFRDREQLLLEAPTGSGKTLGVLFPALKSMADGHVSRLFFLTSRSTGAMAARTTLEVLNTAQNKLRSVEIIAKDKACPVPGTACRSDQCAYARGYYDRRGDAVNALLDHAVMDVETLSQVAEAHMVCPFELSLDAALWADVIVGDYNYIFDPVVRLQRFADDAAMGLLIDESHQLAERGRSMLSLELHRRWVQRALAETPPDRLARRLRGLDRAMLELRKIQALTSEQEIQTPEAILRAIARVMESLADDNLELERFPETQELIYTLSRWQRSETWRDSDNFAFFAAAESKQTGAVKSRSRNVSLKLACLDPGPYLADVLNGYGPHVRFSGTLTPLPVYQRLHGLAQAPFERVASLFRPEQLGLYIIRNLSVLYRDRAQSLDDLADLLVAAAGTQRGNYLAALPSFEYLEQLAQKLRNRHPGLDLQVQERAMSLSMRQEFVESFTCDSARFGLVVLGGVFAESVDFHQAGLKGVFCVGVGLPPAEPVREAIAARFAEDDAVDGVTVAYQQPAMQKILQMAGRLLRGPADRGVICLIDARFQRAEYQRFFPQHWQPQTLLAADLPIELEKFWQGDHALPRLAAP